MTHAPQALVIGAGPAGLMAAEELAGAGFSVLVAEAKPSVGRKFLMAGKSGLNLTKDEPPTKLLTAYGAAEGRLAPIVTAFDADAVQSWARGLGQEVFTGSSGRVFPRAMKASPLLRAWMARLAESGVEVRTRWRWLGPEDGNQLFETPEGRIAVTPRVTVLAMGGASWARLGSDGAWADILTGRGVPITPFRPSNGGLVVAWSAHMAVHFGAPVKGTALIAGGRRVRGDYVISRRGLEGGGIYAVFADVRDGAELRIDLVPDLPFEEVARRLDRPRGKATVSAHLRKVLGLDPVRRALLQEFGRPLPVGEAFARLIKGLPVRHGGPRPMDEAISTAGGIAWDGLGPGLEVLAVPGLYAAGEMIDWEAPTGGYLLTACLATGRWAGRHAAKALG